MLSISPIYLLCYIPLILIISLVHGGTRHEDTRLILKSAWHTCHRVTALMGAIFLVLFVLRRYPVVVVTSATVLFLIMLTAWIIRAIRGRR